MAVQEGKAGLLWADLSLIFSLK